MPKPIVKETFHFPIKVVQHFTIMVDASSEHEAYLKYSNIKKDVYPSNHLNVYDNECEEWLEQYDNKDLPKDEVDVFQFDEDGEWVGEYSINFNPLVYSADVDLTLLEKGEASKDSD